MATASSSGSLYVGDLAEDVTEAVLFDTFKEVGSIISIRVCRDAVLRKSLGYAYVNYQSAVDAERALALLNYKTVKGRSMRVMWSQRDPALRKSGAGNIFVKNLDKGIDHKSLCDTFSTFGNILSCKVVTDPQGESRGFGFVHFEGEEAAKEAIERMNGMLLNGVKVYVGPFVKRQTRQGQANAQFTNLYVKELIESADADFLREKFSKFGSVTSTCTKKHTSLDKVFGFVNFAEHEDAAKAVDEWNGKEVEGVSAEGRKLYCQRAMKRAEREHEMRKKLMAERAKKQFAPGNNLYVKNLGDGVTDADLRALFAPFGSVTSAVVMKERESRASKGFGFVCFEKPDAANKALSEMNGRMIDAKPLYVNVAQRKEVRRSMLEMQYTSRQQRGPGVSQTGFPGPGYAMPGFQAPPMGYPPRGMPMPGMRPMMQQPMWSGRGMPMPGMRRMPPSRGGWAPAPGMMPQGRPGVPFPGFRPGMMPQPQPGRREDGSTLTAEALAAMSADQQKNALGEQLYHKISVEQPDQAAKITGMLLEMDVSETLNLLESPDLLRGKIQEALSVLRAHEQHTLSHS
eukprot:TRINITY_DN3202_c0_g2_i1.p1 TRINITY_DN3202_c0_g2~~TRINITY_DN3202_c0_g2_i1.p1  ORF type:complete len:572 (+),score=199.30 TRINITY_DN3202_c0_g2_i1:127-1842(+)